MFVHLTQCFLAKALRKKEGILGTKWNCATSSLVYFKSLFSLYSKDSRCFSLKAWAGRPCRCWRCWGRRESEGRPGRRHRWQGPRRSNTPRSACFMRVAAGSGRPAVCDPSWGCGSRCGPPGSPAAFYSSSHPQRPQTESCGRAMRWVRSTVIITIIIFIIIIS